jgi:hypothetical protein
MNIDWWALIWSALGSAVDMWIKAIAANPLPWLAILGVVFLGFLLPIARRRY